jgi:hypothetical protein
MRGVSVIQVFEVIKVMSKTWALALGRPMALWCTLPTMGLAFLPGSSPSFNILNLLKMPSIVNPANIDSEPKNSTCPQEIQSLTNLMLRDLPGYANRAMQRSRRLGLGSSNSYVVVAGNPDFNPINTDINPSFGSGTQPDIARQRFSDRELHQVFFTTLNREYQGSRLVEVQEFHRLFLINTSQGWQLTLMYSRSGSIGSQSPPALTPVRESLNSAVGQAVSTWLRDCQAGTIRNYE